MCVWPHVESNWVREASPVRFCAHGSPFGEVWRTRSANGRGHASADDFFVTDLCTIVDRIALDYEGTTQPGASPSTRVGTFTTKLIGRVAVYTLEGGDGSVLIYSLDVDDSND